MRLIAAVLFAILLTGTAYSDPCEAPLPRAHAEFSGSVSYVIDGDGICVGFDRGGVEVRLGDFDAPELREPGGQAAKSAIALLVLGKNVECTACEGVRSGSRCKSYDRVVATCRFNGIRIGDLMRAAGVAEGGR